MAKTWCAVALCALVALPAFGWPPRVDSFGDPLPAGAAARLGTTRWRHDSVLRGVFFSPDGKRLYTHSEDGTVRAWDAGTGQELHRLAELAHCWKLQISADGQILAGLRNREAVVHSRKTGKNQAVIPGQGYVVGFALSPDGRTLALGNTAQLSGEENAIELWDAATGKQLLRGPAHGGGVSALAFTPDGKTLISSGGDGRIRFWDSATLKEKQRQRQEDRHGRAAWCLSISADGKTLVSAANDVRLWEVASGKLLRRLEGHGSEVYSASISGDGRRIASVGIDRTLRSWDAFSGKELWKNELLGSSPYSVPSFSPDGKVLAVPGGTSTVLLFDAETGQRLNVQAAHEGHLTALAFSPDGKLLVSSGYDPGMRVWDVAETMTKFVLPQPGAVNSLAFSPDGMLLAAGGQDVLMSAIWLWDMTSGKLKKKLQVPGSFSAGWEVSGLRFTPDGKWLTGKTSARGFYRWDVASGKGESLPAKVDAVGPFELLSPDGKLAVVVTSTGQEKIWAEMHTGSGVQPWMTFPIEYTVTIRDAQSGLNLARFKETVRTRSQFDQFHLQQSSRLIELSTPQVSAVISPDGRFLLRQQSEHMRLCELASGKEMWSKPRANARALWFSPDGTVVGMSGQQGCFGLFDARTGQALGGWVSAGRHHLQALSPSGQWLATGQSDTSILLWDISDLARTRRTVVPAVPADLEKLWTDLAGDEPTAAYRAMGRLADSAEGIAFVGKKLQPGAESSEDRLATLIEALNEKRFPVRQAASRELQQLGSIVRPALAAVLTSKPTLEVRRRIEALLADETVPDRLVPPGEPLRRHRAVQLLEGPRTAEARAILERLATGPDHAALTREARAALERIKIR